LHGEPLLLYLLEAKSAFIAVCWKQVVSLQGKQALDRNLTIISSNQARLIWSGGASGCCRGEIATHTHLRHFKAVFHCNTRQVFATDDSNPDLRRSRLKNPNAPSWTKAP